MNCNLGFEDFIRAWLFVSGLWWAKTGAETQLCYITRWKWSGDPANTPGTQAANQRTGSAGHWPIRGQYWGHVTRIWPIRGLQLSWTDHRPAPICLWSVQPPGHEWNFDKISELILTLTCHADCHPGLLHPDWRQFDSRQAPIPDGSHTRFIDIRDNYPLPMLHSSSSVIVWPPPQSPICAISAIPGSCHTVVTTQADVTTPNAPCSLDNGLTRLAQFAVLLSFEHSSSYDYSSEQPDVDLWRW